MPGRCGYGAPGRGGMPGCCVRTGCDGSGRGPPGVGLGVVPGYAGRGGATPGARVIVGRAAVPAWAPAPVAGGRAVAGIAGRSVFAAAGRGTTRGAGPVG